MAMYIILIPRVLFTYYNLKFLLRLYFARWYWCMLCETLNTLKSTKFSSEILNLNLIMKYFPVKKLYLVLKYKV